MLNLKSLTDDQLHESTVETAKNERAITVRLLNHLNEVERRHLYSKYSASSLHGYCVKELKMSDPAAGRRVSAARLLRDVPAIENKILGGSLSMTTASQTGVFLSKEARSGNLFDHAAKQVLCEELENKSTRDVQDHLMSKSPDQEIHLKDKVKPKTKKISEVRVYLSKKALADLDRMKEIWSHAMPGASYSKVIERMAEESVDRLDPVSRAERGVKRALKKAATQKSQDSKSAKIEHERATSPAKGSIVNGASTPAPEEKIVEPNSVPVSASNTSTDCGANGTGRAPTSSPKPETENATFANRAPAPERSHAFVKNAVWARDGGRCTYCDEATGDRCSSRHFLEEDHVIPKAMGGDYSVKNIRLRCRAHNQRHAIDSYGLRKMSPYFRATRIH